MSEDSGNRHKILVAHPGMRTTRLAYFNNSRPMVSEEIPHAHAGQAKNLFDEIPRRLEDIRGVLRRWELEPSTLDAVVGPGGLLEPMPPGVYPVTDEMLSCLRNVSRERWGVEHPWNLAAALCAELAKGSRARAFVVDPTLNEEMIPAARLMGVPGYERHGFANMLNLRATAAIVAKQMDIPVEKLNLIGAHLGAGVSIVAFEKGKTVDMNQTLLGDGPMGSRRAGTLSHACLLDLAFSGKYTKAELSKHLIDSAGIFAHLGLEKSDEVEREIKFGNEKAALVLQAFAYQVSKEICGLAATLRGKVDGIFLTGGLANSKMSMSWIKSRIAFLGPVFVYPGDIEMEYLAGRVRDTLDEQC